MQMRPNLNFAGNAADVIEHYHAALGGDVEITRYAGSPVADGMPPEWAHKILYARLTTPYGALDIMDAPPGRESDPGGNVAIAIDDDDDERAARTFAILAQEGAVMMPFEETFFARKFGMVSDKFGTRWMVSVAPVALART